jgi:hypothetical protein
MVGTLSHKPKIFRPLAKVHVLHIRLGLNRPSKEYSEEDVS